ncbi:MAG: hypothetical protein KAT15_27960 [Bacteroidales bacterium]|nr:hypothetical protein [Bacteroidales bacterium]
MRILYQLLSLAGLVLVILPSILLYSGTITPEQMKSHMLLGTVLWFAGAIPWLGKKKKEI